MTEEDLENEVEILPKNQLAIMIKDSDLPEEKSSILMGKFATFFVDVQTWEKKANAIKVTNESQKAIMDQARQGRLFIRKVRIDIEKCRKELKEESVKEGRAIDKVARFLSDALEPIETHLDRQEHYIEYREAEKQAIIQAEVERKMEEERVAEEKRRAEELEVTRSENERLRLEAEKTDRANKEALKKVQEANDKVIQIEREKSRKAEEELRLKRQQEMKSEADKIRQAELLKSADDVTKMKKLYDDLMNIDWPEVISHEAKKARLEAMSHVHVGTTKVDKYVKSMQVNEEEI